MGWSCEVCTFLNAVDDANKCEICETLRSDAIHLTTDVHRKKRPAEQKPTVQGTLFGGIAQDPPKSKNTSKKPKASSSRVDAKQSTLRLGAPSTTDVASTVASSQGTLLGVFVQDSSKSKTAPETSKTPSTQMDTKQSTLFNARGKTIGSSTVPLWTTTASRDIPRSMLKERAKLAMKQLFGVEELRFLQPKAVSCALKRKSQIVVMATGGGKSLCYQLPAVVLGGTTIVVAPLIALMEDQVQALNQKGVSAAVISSNKGASENREIMDRLVGRRRSKAKSKSVPDKPLEHITVLYVTPEQVQTGPFRDALQELFQKNQLSLFAIDEAHCLSSWGHDFRKAYLRLDYLRDKYPEVPLIACTATATAKVLDDIKTTLKLEHSPCHIGSFDRPNIYYRVKYKDSMTTLGGDACKHLVHFIKKQHARSAERSLPCSGIVYCHTRADTTELASAIEDGTGIRSVSYHGGMKPDERTRIQQMWTSGEAQIAVATVAFGMGIDLAHVRYVVHWNLAKTPEAFYQESGRAGRDGLPSTSLLYYSKDDASKFQYLLSKSNEESHASNMAALKEMVNYCIVPGCRRVRLLQHFGEKMADPAAICNKSCDYCVDPEAVEKAIEAAAAVGDFVSYQRQPDQPRVRTPMDDEGDNSDKDDWGQAFKVGGLQVKGSGAPTEILDADPDTFSGKPTANFARASSILSKYEAIECKSSSSGFVNFKEKSDSNVEKQDDRIRIPQHLIPPKKPTKTSAAVKEKSSSDHAAEVDTLSDGVAKLRSEHAQMVERANRTKARRPPPPPPPSVSFSSSNKRKR